MKITGKAKVDFIKYFWNKVDFELEENSIDEYLMIFESNYEVIHQQASVIEWFDAVEIYICIGRFGYSINTDRREINKKVHGNRNFITGVAINKAIEIYNNR